MIEVPGSSGYPVFGDKSVEFYKDPKEFISRKIKETGSRVFLSRLINTPTVFVCSEKETHELLNEKSSDFDHGYRDFLFNSYGDNILFENGESAAHLKSCLSPLFCSPDKYQSMIERTCGSFIESLSHRKSPINVYEEFKALMTKLCLELFLGYSDRTCEISDSIAKLSTLHWHGIISMPVNVKIPFAGESGWRKALQAKEELMSHIRTRVSQLKPKARNEAEESLVEHEEDKTGNIIWQMWMAPFSNPKSEIEQHLLLFVSALIPKAFASIVSSFVLEMAGQKMATARERATSDGEFHQRVLLEVQRLWPPFFGGRRIANKNTRIGKYKIPKGYAVVYVSYFAHRDNMIFPNADNFIPDRWLNNRRDQIFTFGAGPRSCVGIHLIQHILIFLTKQLLERYSWKTEGDNELFTYKLLPVTRPDPIPLVIFDTK